MEYRELGTTGLKSSAIGLGCNQISLTEGPAEAAEVERTLAAALDAGINFFDTSNAYGKGGSERLLGKALAGKRDRVLVCSKTGMIPVAMSGLERRARKLARRIARRLTPGRVNDRGPGVGWRYDYSADSVRASLESSLRRLGTDYLDIYLLHNPGPEIAAQAETFEMLARLKEAGHIRHFGFSLSGHSTTDDLLPFLEVPGLSVVQLFFNPARMADLHRIAPRAKEKGIGIIAREPFNKGEIFTYRPLLDLAAANPAYSPAQMAVRFGLQQEGVALVLAGMRTRTHLNEVLGALSGPGLTQDEITKIFSMAEII